MELWLKSHCDELLTAQGNETPRITSAIGSHLSFRPTEADATYSDRLFIVSTTTGSGCCGCPHPESSLDVSNSILADGTFAEDVHSCAQIAYMDALLEPLLSSNDEEHNLVGSVTEKAEARAAILRDEILRALGGLPLGRHARIGMVGVVGSIISELTNHDMDVRATEFDESLIGQTIANVQVESEANTPQMIEESDVALVTGMTIATETLGSILEAAAHGNTPLVFFAQTGRNILRTLDFPTPTTIVAEKFPHYIWPGPTNITISRIAPQQ